MMNATISEKLKTLPAAPGVYIMRDEKGNIIYVGKAKILKNRVRQYFHASATHTPKVMAMIEKIADFEYIITDTEFESLCLECNLIKEHKPRYNILLKDDKGYPFIKITNEDYPRITLARQDLHDGAQYFGPYPSSAVIYETLDIIHRLFKVRHCSKVFPRDFGRQRPCLYHAMHRCDAPCRGNISKEAYQERFHEISRFLRGEHAALVRELEKKMAEHAENLAFEAAADCRDKIESIRRIAKEQKVIGGNQNADVVAFAICDDLAVFSVFFVRNGKLLGSKLYKEEGFLATDLSEITDNFLSAYYNRSVSIPSLILCARPLKDAESTKRWLTEKRGKPVEVRTPIRGEKRKLCDMAEKNCEHALENFRMELLKKTNRDKAIIELGKEIGLSKTPERVEAYDISNTGGDENVGSMVVFRNGKKAPAEYKRFKIKNIIGSNDYDCMREVLARRFMRFHEKDESFKELPDLILVDGGRGHVAAAEEILADLAISVPVLGMVKDSGHHTRGLMRADGEVQLAHGSPAFRLVTLIQDEAHRFAITYHKKLRAQKSFQGELDAIPGVGPKRKKALMTHFKSMAKIRSASASELSAVEGIDKATAQNIFSHFQKKD